jgi:lipopolysaccharide assembly outer membrane protein LptD (OstA)
VLDWGPNRITGARLDFDLALQTGTMTEANGWIEPEAILVAEKIQKLDEDHVLIEKGTSRPARSRSRTGRSPWATGCSTNHYAHLRNVRMNVGKVRSPSPWLLWPIKGDRATGLFSPVGSRTSTGPHQRGFFWAIAENADITTIGDYYWNGGPAAGLEANWLPTERGRIRLTGYYLKDTVRDERRYMSRLQLEQPFGNGWKLGADLNTISDFAYYQDFERNLTSASWGLVPSGMGS